ncbi:MAG: metallophosphoesterase [Sulfuritalea sp.]|nr:metallophosphoesterase [Sulfuritalea sp.]
MKIALYSDLHLEHMPVPWAPPATEADVVILAGDIASGTSGLYWAADAFPGKQVLYVAGNHEYYHAGLELLNEMRGTARRLGIRFLERDVAEIADATYTDTDQIINGHVRFLGCTLWSGFSLYGKEHVLPYMAIAQRGINDYFLIAARQGKTLSPGDTLALHRSAVDWLDAELAKPFDGKTVVVTHFAPHRQCIAPLHQGNDLSPYFVTDLEWLMKKHPIATWCYGHTHTNINFTAESGCQVVSNQRGYPVEAAADIGFRPEWVIEL